MLRHTQTWLVLNTFKQYRLSLVVALVIFVLSCIVVRDIPKIRISNGDKYGHLLAYFTLSIVFLFEHAKVLRWSNRFGRWSIVIAALCILYGITMEGLQGLVFTYRSFELADMLANTLGVLIGTGLFWLVFNQLKSRFISV